MFAPLRSNAITTITSHWGIASYGEAQVQEGVETKARSGREAEAEREQGGGRMKDARNKLRVGRLVNGEPKTTTRHFGCCDKFSPDGSRATRLGINAHQRRAMQFSAFSEERTHHRRRHCSVESKRASVRNNEREREGERNEAHSRFERSNKREGSKGFKSQYASKQ